MIRQELARAEIRWQTLCKSSNVRESMYKLSLFCDVLMEKKSRAEKTLKETFENFSEKIAQIEASGKTSISSKYMERLCFVYDWKKLNLILELTKELEQRVEKMSRRKKHTKSQIKTLEKWWSEHLNNPYPQKSDVVNLTSLTGLSSSQIRIFFQNRRSRNGIKKEKKKKKKK